LAQPTRKALLTQKYVQNDSQDKSTKVIYHSASAKEQRIGEEIKGKFDFILISYSTSALTLETELRRYFFTKKSN
jgi:hypothetical protein